MLIAVWKKFNANIVNKLHYLFVYIVNKDVLLRLDFLLHCGA